MDRIKIDTENKIRASVLTRAYEVYMMNPRFSGYLINSHKLAEELGYEHDELLRPIEFLGEEGLLDINRTGIGGDPYYELTITSEGIKEVEPPGPFNPKPLTTYIEDSDAEESLKQEYRELLNEIKKVLEKAEVKNETLREKAPAIAETIGSFLAPIINKFLTPGP